MLSSCILSGVRWAGSLVCVAHTVGSCPFYLAVSHSLWAWQESPSWIWNTFTREVLSGLLESSTFSKLKEKKLHEFAEFEFEFVVLAVPAASVMLKPKPYQAERQCCTAGLCWLMCNFLGFAFSTWWQHWAVYKQDKPSDATLQKLSINRYQTPQLSWLETVCPSAQCKHWEQHPPGGIPEFTALLRKISLVLATKLVSSYFRWVWHTAAATARKKLLLINKLRQSTLYECKSCHPWL